MLTDHCTRRASERNPLAFAPLPHRLRKDRRLTTRAVTLAAALLEHARDQPRCDPTNRRLAADDHCSIRTVQYALAALRAAGWIAVEQGPDGRVIRLLWREAPGNGPPGPVQPPAEPPCNHPPDPLQPPAEPPCNALRDKERSAERRRNVTPSSTPETTTAPPRTPQEPRPEASTAPRPSEPVRPLLDELKALPGAAPKRVQSLAWRLAHHLKDVASIGFFIRVLGLVAQGLEPLQRLLDAFRVADRARGTVEKPGAILNSTWKAWTPPVKPSEINRPVSHQAPATVPRPEPPPGPEPEAAAWSPELIARWERIARLPGHPEARIARTMLAAYHDVRGDAPHVGPEAGPDRVPGAPPPSPPGAARKP